jgi:hypothetical protein
MSDCAPYFPPERRKVLSMDASADRFRTDRRLSRRYNLKTALRIRIWKSALPEARAESINLSDRGILFATDARFQKGEAIEILLEMPEEITGEPTTEWRCTGLIVRVDPVDSPKGQLSVGVRFDCYEVSRLPPVTAELLSSVPRMGRRLLASHYAPPWLFALGAPASSQYTCVHTWKLVPGVLLTTQTFHSQ